MIDGEQRIDLLLRLTAHALILSGLICVILTKVIPVPLWLLALAAHPLSILMQPKKGRYFFNTVVVLSFGYALFLFFFLRTPFLLAFTQFLIVVQAVKLFHLDKSKDYLQLAGLGLLTVLAAAGLTSQPYFLFFFFILLLFGIWFLFLLQLKRAMEQHPALPSPPRSLASPSLLLGITGVALGSFLITIIIFFTLPRITLSVSGREQWEGASSGFSDVVDLGTVGPVRLDNRVVMRVELPQFKQRPPFPLYWRGMSFARWDGQTWEKENTIIEKIPHDKEGTSIHPEMGNKDAIHQIIMIEPLGTDILFCLHPPLEIRGDFPLLLVDEGGGLHLPSPPQERYRYEVYSAPRSGGQGLYQGFAEKPTETYLQVPEATKEVWALARQIVAGAITPQQKIQRVIAYLRANCTYSLNPKRDGRLSPVEDFLLHSREGYCEHFATAAAVLLRESGVPTRLVSGFLQGEWNSLGRYFMVRQRDAHTWIESYLPDKGWVTFDPTPAAEATTFLPVVSTFYRYYDFLKLKWNRYIIQYSRRDQIRILSSFRQQLLGIRLFSPASPLQRAREKTAQSPLYFLGAMAVLVCILMIAWGLRRERAFALHEASTLPSEISFYIKMLKILKKKRILKRACETPAEFADRVNHEGGALSPWLERITSLYYRVRFGQIPLTPTEEVETWEIIRALKKNGHFPRPHGTGPMRERGSATP